MAEPTDPERRTMNEESKIMNFVCADCANGVHTECKAQHCECQHRVK